MRCLSIANVLERIGCEVVFLVSSEQSYEFVKARNGYPVVLSANPMRLELADAEKMSEYCKAKCIEAVLIDTYAVDDRFVSFLRHLIGSSIKLIYIDDMYNFKNGRSVVPCLFDVDLAVNYDFRASLDLYAKTYSATHTKLLIGPKYAPLRKDFQNAARSFSDEINRVLVTTGSTNPQCALERMVDGCLEVFPDTEINVVVGPLAQFEIAASRKRHLDIHYNADMIRLMQLADIAVSAAGSTLYELACMGVPTLAIPLVKNQIGNAMGFRDLGLGSVIDKADWNSKDVVKSLKELSASRDLRKLYHEQGMNEVDGYGATRIANAIEELLYER